MFFNASKVLVALAGVTAATASIASSRRGTPGGVVDCNLLLKPAVPIDPSTTNLVAEFNFLIGRSLAIDANPNGNQGIGGGNGNTILAENADGTFLVNTSIAADGLTAAQSGAIITAWVGETKEGFTTNWLVLSATCDA